MRWIRNFGTRVRREPAFAIIFVITLALGVGANAAMLSALRGYLVRPLPYQDAGKLVSVGWRIPKISGEAYAASVPIYRYFSVHDRTFSHVALADQGEASVTIGKAAHTVPSAQVTASLFATLGMQAFLGSFFSSTANKPGGPSVVVVSHAFWRGALHADPHAIGRMLSINGQLHRIVAVMPQSAFFPSRKTALYMPMVITPSETDLSQTTTPKGVLVARLAPDVDAAALPVRLDTASQRYLGTLPPGLYNPISSSGFAFVGESLRTHLYGRTVGRLGLIELGALVLLILAVVSLVNLTLMRALRRRHEIALRLALGANRRSLFALALGETLPLGLIGGFLAIGIAYAGVAMLQYFGVGTSDTAFRITVDPWIILVGFVIALSCATFAALPMVLMPQRTLFSRLMEGARGTSSNRANRVQRMLNFAQVAFAVALLVNAALIGVVLNRASRLDPGFNPNHLVVAQLDLRGPRFKKAGAAERFAQTLRLRAESLRGVENAGLSNEAAGFPFLIPAQARLFSPGNADLSTGANFAEHMRSAYVLPVGAQLLDTLGLPLLRGHELSPEEQKNGRAVVIDRVFAKRLYGSTDVIGKMLISGASLKRFTIVGVVGHLRWGPSQTTPDVGTVITAYDYAAGNRQVLLLRTRTPTPVLVRELKSLLHKLAPGQSFTRIAPMSALMQESLAPVAAPASLYGLFGLIALLLAAVGVYGVISYRVNLRLPEFALRQVLGATPARVVLIALAEGGLIAGTGIGLGLAGGWVLRHFAQGFAITGLMEPFAYAGAALAMLFVVLLATVIPALRARRADLTTLLRPQ